MSSMKIEPPKDEREYVRHTETGDRGFLVRCQETGKQYVRLDRPSQVVDRPYWGIQRKKWTDDSDFRALSENAVGRICFEADRALAYAQHDYSRARTTWDDVQKRTNRVNAKAWRTVAPPGDPMRKDLWNAIHGAMKKYVQGYEPPEEPA